MKKVFTLIAAIALFATAAMAETVDTYGHKFSEVKSTDYGLTQYGLETDLGTFYFTINGATGAVTGTVYTMSDMDTSYCFYSVDSYTYYNFLSGTFQMTADGTFEATGSYTDGNTYNIHIAPLAPITEPKDTVTLTFNNKALNRITDATASQGVFQLVGATQDVDYYLYFAVYSNAIAGSYTQDDIYADYTALYFVNGDDYTEIELNNLLGDAVVNGNASAATAQIQWVGTDSVLYILNFTYADPVAQTQQTFLANDLQFAANEYYDLYLAYYSIYVYDFQATNSEYILAGTVYNEENDDAYGSWDYEDGTIEYNIYDASTQTADGEPYNGVVVISKTGTQTSLVATSLFYGDVEWVINVTGDATAVENVEASNYEVYNEGRVIVLNGAEGQNAAIYDIAGRMISNTMVNSDNARFEVPAAGVYVVRVNGESFRVVVK